MGYGGAATEGQYAGTAVVAATDAILGTKSEGVPAGKATTEGDGGPGNLAVIDITEGDACVYCCGTAVFTVGKRGTCGGDRGVVGCGDIDGAGDAAAVLGPCPIGVGVGYLPADGAAGAGRGEVIGAVDVGDAAQGGLVLGYGGAATEGQYAATAVVAAADAILGGEAEGVSAGQSTANGDGGCGELGVIAITEGEGAVYRCGAVMLTVGECAACGGDRGVVTGGEVYGAGDAAAVLCPCPIGVGVGYLPADGTAGTGRGGIF